MKTLYNTILETKKEEEIQEGLIKNTISLIGIKTLSPDKLREGILNMYDYICDEDDINLFYQDFPLKDQILWKTLYQLYQKKIWSIVDISSSYSRSYRGKSRNKNRPPRPYDDDDDDSNTNETDAIISKLGLSTTELTPLSIQLRRELRQIINDSRNNKLELKPGEIDKVIVLYDNVKNVNYILTINRVTGFFKKLMSWGDKKLMEMAFKRMCEESSPQ